MAFFVGVKFKSVDPTVICVCLAWLGTVSSFKYLHCVVLLIASYFFLIGSTLNWDALIQYTYFARVLQTKFYGFVKLYPLLKRNKSWLLCYFNVRKNPVQISIDLKIIF